MSDVNGLQERLDAKADAQLHKDINAAIDAFRNALSGTQCFHEEMQLGLWNKEKGERVEGRTSVQSLLNVMKNFLLVAGIAAYRSNESQAFMEKVDSIQKQIDEIERL